MVVILSILKNTMPQICQLLILGIQFQNTGQYPAYSYNNTSTWTYTFCPHIPWRDGTSEGATNNRFPAGLPILPITPTDCSYRLIQTCRYMSSLHLFILWVPACSQVYPIGTYTCTLTWFVLNSPITAHTTIISRQPLIWKFRILTKMVLKLGLYQYGDT